MKMKFLGLARNHTKIFLIGFVLILVLIIVGEFLFISFTYPKLSRLRIPKIIMVFFVFLIALIGAIIIIVSMIWRIFNFIQCSWKAQESKGWFATEGKIVQADIHEIITDEYYFCEPLIR